jgi:hypothetical protein
MTIEVRERPISFTMPMLIAAREDRKTQTRRVANLPPSPDNLGEWEPTTIGGAGVYQDIKHTKPTVERVALWHTRTGQIVTCRYQVGDHLWCRESALIDGWYDGAENTLPLVKLKDNEGREHTVLYRIDYPDLIAIDDDGELRYRKDGSEASPWKSSRFMPKWAARIWLEITDIRAERLNEITEEEAKAEGTSPSIVGQNLDSLKYRAGYQALWNHINGKTHPWNTNPYVWVISFKRIKT